MGFTYGAPILHPDAVSVYPTRIRYRYSPMRVLFVGTPPGHCRGSSPRGCSSWSGWTSSWGVVVIEVVSAVVGGDVVGGDVVAVAMGSAASSSWRPAAGLWRTAAASPALASSQSAVPRAAVLWRTAGFPCVDNTYSHAPAPVVCQICFSPGHSTLICPRFVGTSTPALAALPTGEHNASMWYPDSGASAHMTPHEGQSDEGASSSGLQ
ncbi:unnamed protein product [Cuscuta europaea]|uniref:Uncharacterized protein n=1 Tax=Cuscuta europaea TaxID=41803 RepID=A0A9P1DZN1_CUSEU|nr:unnamed protein product [Cuscuta europaea]